MSDEATTDERRPSELDLLRDEMRAGFQSMRDRFDGVDKRFDGVDKRLDSVDKRLDGVDRRLEEHDKRFDSVDSRLGEHDKRFVSLETRIAESETATRRHFDIVAESLRADMKVVIDQNTATSKKLDRLITRNAIEHAAILDAVTDHEVRITSLENAAGTTRPPST